MPKFPYIVRRVQAVPGSPSVEFKEIGEHGCADIRDAKDSCDRLQREFDEDCDPVRVYVYKDGSPVPVYAGLQMKDYGSYRYGT